MSKHTKLIDKAKKLKALADRGDSGEADNAAAFYYDFLKKNNITEQEIDTERFTRSFRIIASEYEALLSHIIMSINPFSIIERTKDAKFICVLDEEDFIEVEYKFMVFHRVFKANEKKLLNDYTRLDEVDYEKEKLLFFTAFFYFYQKHFVPDAYAIKKLRLSNDSKINPDMEEIIILDEKPRDLSEEEKKLKEAKKALDESLPVTFTGSDVDKIQLYTSKLKEVFYVRSNRTLEPAILAIDNKLKKNKKKQFI